MRKVAQELEEDRPLGLVVSKATRWNSRLYLTERFLRLAGPIRSALEEIRKTVSNVPADLEMLTELGVRLLSAIVSVLKPFENLFESPLQASRYRLFYPKIYELKEFLAMPGASAPQAVQILKEELLTSLTKRFQSLWSVGSADLPASLPGAASALDPRTGHLS